MVVFNQETASGIVSRIKIFKVFNCADINLGTWYSLTRRPKGTAESKDRSTF